MRIASVDAYKRPGEGNKYKESRDRHPRLPLNLLDDSDLGGLDLGRHPFDLARLLERPPKLGRVVPDQVRLVRRVGVGKDEQALEPFCAQAVLREHARHGSAQDLHGGERGIRFPSPEHPRTSARALWDAHLFRIPLEHGAVRDLFQPAGELGVVAVQLLVGLLAGDGDFAGVLDDDIVSTVVCSKGESKVDGDSSQFIRAGQRAGDGPVNALAWS